MKKRWSGLSFKSIRFQLTAFVLVILLPLIGFLLYNNLYAIRVIHGQVAESNRNLLTLYLKGIDANLEAVGNRLNAMVTLDTNLRVVATSMDPSDRILAKVALVNQMQADSLNFDTLDALFFYDKHDNDLFYGYRDNAGMTERTRVADHIADMIRQEGKPGRLLARGWFSEKIGDQYYLLRLLPTYDNFIGAWVNVRNLLGPLSFINLGDSGAALLLNRNREAMAASRPFDAGAVDLTGNFDQYYLSGVNNRYLVVGTTSAGSDLALAAVIPDDKILENLPYLRSLILVILLCAVLLVPLSIQFIRRIILKPMNRLMTAMRKVQGGDIEVRLTDIPASTEFAVLNQTFNHMLDEIHDLRISVYEEQLGKQRTEMEHLQSQVNPHFFLNSLNIIYRLAQTKRYELIQEMTLSLIGYFRFMFRQRRPLVPLRDELDLVRNYLRIQELRFPQMLTKEIRVPDYVLDTPVPPLVVQTLVENAIKYAVTGDAPTHLEVLGELVTTQGTTSLAPAGRVSSPEIVSPEPDGRVNPQETASLELRIRDNGAGFDEAILPDLRAGRRVEREDGMHTGLWNLRKRLRMLYGDAAWIAFNNLVPAGAEVVVVLPLKPKTEVI